MEIKTKNPLKFANKLGNNSRIREVSWRLACDKVEVSDLRISKKWLKNSFLILELFMTLGSQANLELFANFDRTIKTHLWCKGPYEKDQ